MIESGFKEINNLSFTSLHRVDDCDLRAIGALYNNCLKLNQNFGDRYGVTTLNFDNVDSVDKWFPDIVCKVMNNVDYIANSTKFEIHKLVNGSIYCRVLNCDLSEFDTYGEMIDFLESEKFSTFVLYSIVNLKKVEHLRSKWVVISKLTSQDDEIRDKKIENIINGVNNN